MTQAIPKLPRKGTEIDGWKKLRGGIIAHLLIPADARRVRPADIYQDDLEHCDVRKCRAEKAIVLGLYDPDTDEPIFADDYARLDWPGAFGVLGATSLRCWSPIIYREDQWVIPDTYDPRPEETCSYGIHFFLTYEEAKRYRY